MTSRQTSLRPYREKVIQEIIASEKSYLDCLDILLKYFLDNSLCESVLTKQEVSVLFGDLRSIRLLNQVLYDSILSLPINEAFGEISPFLKVYSAYARNFSSSQNLLQKLSTKDSFVKWCKRQEENPNVRGLKLPALLITPIQRIPRYKLLLEELIKHTDDYESKSLSRPLQLIKVVADSLNSSVADFENTAKLIEIQRSFGTNAPKIVIPGRNFIREGHIKLLKAHYPIKFKRKLFLFSDAILFAKEDSSQSNHSCCLLPIRRCHVQNLNDTENFSFKITCGNEILILCCESPLAADTWVHSITTAICGAKRNRATLLKESTIVEPQYRPQLSARRNSSITKKWKSKRKMQEALPNPEITDISPIPMPRKRRNRSTACEAEFKSNSQLLENNHSSMSFAFDDSSFHDGSPTASKSLNASQMSKKTKPWWAEYEQLEEVNPIQAAEHGIGCFNFCNIL